MDERDKKDPATKHLHPDTLNRTVSLDLDKVSEEIDGIYQDLQEMHTNNMKSRTKDMQLAANKIHVEFKKKVRDDLLNHKDELIKVLEESKVTIVLPNTKTVTSDPINDHPQFVDVVKKVNAFGKLLMMGAAGTGKTYMCQQLAERMDTPFYKYSCSSDTSTYDFIGYKQPRSEDYLNTAFLKAYEEGGIFLLDEADAMNASVALFINGIADGSKTITIPHRDSNPIAHRHKDFILIACTNTWGKGSIDYTGRDFQDMALLDRFRVARIEIGYHFLFEKKVSGPNYSFMMDLRKSLESSSSYLSTRNIEDAATALKAGYNNEEVLDILLKDLNKSTVKKVKEDMKTYI